ncbi:uncharacterized protein [Dermacentor andersoni]|uniref:uncharacterized protein n=1 Tax=Dermacentor andersoni TaxID=34620 RepID=UPI0021557D05|nr:uncharacterized protein LOC126531037 isoform X2 [Dermacentor andersoni]XP_054926889.1 uncharacterized protein LOC126531037 isoform X2 [Dermacentor andersoni]XP_054926890.1 uncharacterized protein LOC126531037 isoform X2 [Dermacentor andersoni]
MSSSRAGGGDDEVDGAEGGERARRSALDTRNVVVNLRALAITSVAVDTCKLALATVTTVRRQPNRGFVFLASIAVWSLSAKLAVIVASLAAYGLVFWAASREARRPMLAAAAVFAVAIAMRFLFMIEGAVVVLQESVTPAHANQSSALDAPHLRASADHGAVLTKSELHGPMVHMKHQILDAHSSNTVVAAPPPAPSIVDIVLKILQVNIIHTCSVAVHVVFLLVLRKYMRSTKVKQRLEDMPAEART